MIGKVKLIVFFLIVPVMVVFPQESKKITGENVSTVSPIDVLSTYVHNAQLTDFPAEVITMGKYLILDNIGCALGGSQTELGRKYFKLSANWKGIPESTVIGIGTRVSCMNAAYVNTQLANVLDFDDTYDLYLPGHPGNPFVQTALALGESVGATGEEVLTAVILGYEVSMRIGRALGSLKWQSPMYLDSVTRGTITISSRLLKLDQKGIYNALVHAIEIPLPQERKRFDLRASLEIPEIKANYGLDAIRGILSARLGQQMVTGWDTLLSGDLQQWYLAGGEVEGYDILTGGLGKSYRIMEMSFKPTPSCRLSHGPVTALREALENKPVKAKDIEQIVIKFVKRLDRPEFEIMMQAQFSLRCILALDALGVEPGPKWYITGKFKDPEVRELAAKVKLENDPEAEELEIREEKVKCTAEVTFKNGTVKKATIYHTKGGPGNPMTDAELKAKFKANSIDILSEDRINRIIDTVLNLEKLEKISDLTKLLISPKVTP